MGKYKPLLYPDDVNTWKVVDERERLPLHRWVQVSIPTPGRKGNGTRLIYVDKYSEEFVDRTTGKRMVLVHGPLRSECQITDRPIEREQGLTPAQLRAHQRSTRGSCEECGRIARLVDGTCRPCLRVAS